MQSDEHAGLGVRPLKALRQQKQQAVVCGLIALTVCRIIELDMSDRLVSGTKCTDEFLAASTMASNHRLFWTLISVLQLSKAGSGEHGDGAKCNFFCFNILHRSKVRLKSRQLMWDAN